MAEKTTLIKLRGTVENGKRMYDHPELKTAILQELEGKRFEEIIKKEHAEKTINQLGYYFGGIIAGTCMKMNIFGGWTKSEIDIHLRTILRSYKAVRIVKGKATIEDRYDDIGEYSIDDMSLFLEDVISYLATENIFPLAPEDYNLKKYILHVP